MKRLLLDTHILLWWLVEDSRLNPGYLSEIAKPENDVFVSAASIWEITIKQKKGLLQVPADLLEVVEEEGFEALSITFAHSELAGNLTEFHKDPFDRMLIAQAQIEQMILVTDDSQIQQYEVSILKF